MMVKTDKKKLTHAASESAGLDGQATPGGLDGAEGAAEWQRRAETAEAEVATLHEAIEAWRKRQAPLEAEAASLRKELARERVDALEWLESFWAQFASEVAGRPGVRHDGGLGLLEDAAEALSVGGRLVSAGVDGMDWWVRAPPSAHPASEPVNATGAPGDEAPAKSASASSSALAPNTAKAKGLGELERGPAALPGQLSLLPKEGT